MNIYITLILLPFSSTRSMKIFYFGRFSSSLPLKWSYTSLLINQNPPLRGSWLYGTVRELQKRKSFKETDSWPFGHHILYGFYDFEPKKVDRFWIRKQNHFTLFNRPGFSFELTPNGLSASLSPSRGVTLALNFRAVRTSRRHPPLGPTTLLLAWNVNILPKNRARTMI